MAFAWGFFGAWGWSYFSNPEISLAKPKLETAAGKCEKPGNP